MRIWDDVKNRPVGSDGKPAFAGFIASRAQAERWHAYGYGIPALVDRFIAFQDAWWKRPDEDDRGGELRAFFEAEREAALSAGVPADDPDLWRLRLAPKHIVHRSPIQVMSQPPRPATVQPLP